MTRLITFLFSIIVLFTYASSQTIGIFYDSSVPQFEFAASEVKASLEKSNLNVELKPLSQLSSSYSNTKIVISLANNTPVKNLLSSEGGSTANLDNLGEQAFALRTTQTGQKSHWALGGDVIGTLYGGMQLAENIGFNQINGTYNEEQNPYIKRRGIKFNMALDQQQPSFDSDGDQDKKCIKDVWDITFWKDYIDDLVRHRYNVISWWVRHPFPSMVKLNDYPNVAIANVTDGYGNVVRNMTIEQKISFWQEVMEYAENRSIETYFITWNIRMDGSNGKHGITESGSNQTTKDYLRKSVKQFLINYPYLDGIGVTAGENMPNMSNDAKEKWLWDTYGQGILDAKKLQPNREIRFIHRYWFTDVANILNHFKDYKDPFDLSFKYARAHIYSSPNIVFEDFLLNQLPAGTKSWWNLRNDDIFYYRWGDPQFVRDFILNFSTTKTAGYYMGSDGYTWGRVYTSKDPAFQGKTEMKKHWYKFMLWGRLGYNPNLSTSVFKNHINQHFPEVSSTTIYDAWKSASMVIPQVTRFFWRNWDYEWYPEGCKGGGFYDVNEFITGKTMQGSGILNIVDYCTKVVNNQPITQTTPLNVVENLKNYSRTALQLTGNLSNQGNAELRLTLNDIKAMAYLGNYYSEKISGATNLKLYQLTSKLSYKDSAIADLEQALVHWEKYADISSNQYHPQNLSRTHLMNWNTLTQEVRKDIDIAKGNTSGDISASFDTPINGQKFSPGSDLYVHVLAASPAGISNVKLYVNGTFVRTESTAKYEWNATKDQVLKQVAAGTYVLKAVATDKAGKSIEKSITIKVETPASCTLPWTGTDFSVSKKTVNWTSGLIDISCGSNVDISVDLEGVSPAKMEAADYLNVYYKVDGGSQIVLSENTDGFAKKTVSARAISGKNVEILVKAYTSWQDETYYITNMLVSKSVNSSNVNGVMAKVRPTESSTYSISDFLFYPNPAFDKLTIKLNSEPHAGAQIKLFNSLGTLLDSKAVNNQIEIVPIEGYAPGIYVIKVINGEQILTKRIIKSLTK